MTDCYRNRAEGRTQIVCSMFSATGNCRIVAFYVCKNCCWPAHKLCNPKAPIRLFATHVFVEIALKIPTTTRILEFSRSAWLPCTKLAARNFGSKFPTIFCLLCFRCVDTRWCIRCKHCEFQLLLRISEDGSRIRIVLRAVDWIPFAWASLDTPSRSAPRFPSL